ncbi:MAG: type II secretion system protein [bacterium]
MADPNATSTDRSSDRCGETNPNGSNDALASGDADGPSRAGGSRRRSRARQAGYSLIELLAVIAVLLIIAALAAPQILGMREKARGKECDRLFHALDSEIHNALDDLIFTSTEVIDIVIRAHGDEDRNPRNKSVPVFMQNSNSGAPNYVANAGDLESCQVLFMGTDVLQVMSVQARDPDDLGGQERTFTIGLQ